MKTAIYLRLSRDDGNDSESNSIGNQRELLRKFAAENDFGQVEEFADDGISGTTFERDGFKRMLAAIEAKRVSVVACKDLSRLGRNNALVSFYTEIYFPEKHVRFIAVNDNIDSDKGDDVVMPFRSVINEYYARDISKKCRSVKKSIAYKGAFQGSVAPYGYIKDSPTTLSVDPAHVPIVQEIFRKVAHGWTAFSIMKDLRARRIPTPMETISCALEPKCYWQACTIRYILSNRAYIGDTVGQRFTTKSFKVKKYIERSEGDWIVVPGTHEPIVTPEIFEKAQEYLKAPKRGGRPRQTDTASLFAGIIYCCDCGKRLVRKRSKNSYYYSCTGHDAKGYLGEDRPCSTHYIREDKLAEVVCREINRQFAEFRVSDFKRDAYAIKRLNNTLERYEKREDELKSIIKRLIEKNAKGILDDSTFEEMMHEYQVERQVVENGVIATRAELEPVDIK
jgi:DNA invertase Pin-like site-specific DNA recombinase